MSFDLGDMKEAVDAIAPVERTPHKVLTHGAVCGGCKNRIGSKEWCVTVGRGVAHNLRGCIKAAEEKAAVEAAEAKTEKEERQRKFEATRAKLPGSTALGKKEGATDARRVNETEAKVDENACITRRFTVEA